MTFVPVRGLPSGSPSTTNGGVVLTTSAARAAHRSTTAASTADSSETSNEAGGVAFALALVSVCWAAASLADVVGDDEQSVTDQRFGNGARPIPQEAPVTSATRRSEEAARRSARFRFEEMVWWGAQALRQRQDQSRISKTSQVRRRDDSLTSALPGPTFDDGRGAQAHQF